MLMNDFLEPFGLKRSNVQNWLTRSSVQLRTEYQQTSSGASRQFSRSNVTELALIGALVALGARASDAADWAEAVMDERKRPSFDGSLFLTAPAEDWGGLGDISSFISTERINAQLSASRLNAIKIVDVGAIFRKVDQFFKEDGHHEG